jgi:hypothetical protein
LVLLFCHWKCNLLLADDSVVPGPILGKSQAFGIFVQYRCDNRVELDYELEYFSQTRLKGILPLWPIVLDRLLSVATMFQ